MGVEHVQFVGHESAIYALAFSPDNTLLASGDYGGAIHLWNVKTAKGWNVLRGRSNYWNSVWALAFSPDGALLASGDSIGLTIWDATTHQVRSAKKLGEFVDLAWEPAGRTLACTAAGEVHLIDGQTGETLNILDGHEEAAVAVSWSPSGKLLAAGSYEGSIRVWDVASARPVAILEEAMCIEHGLAFFAEDTVLFTRGNGTLFAWNFETGSSSQRYQPPHTPHMHKSSFTRDGRLVAYGQAGEEYRMIVSAVSGTADPLVLCSDGDYIMSLTFSPDDTMLAIADGADVIRVWDKAQLL